MRPLLPVLTLLAASAVAGDLTFYAVSYTHLTLPTILRV